MGYFAQKAVYNTSDQSDYFLMIVSELKCFKYFLFLLAAYLLEILFVIKKKIN